MDAPAPVWVHEADADMARTGKVHPRDGSLLPYMRHPALWKLLAMGVRSGGMKTTKIAELTTFTDGDLDVPGRPRVIPTPGHSPGHVSFHLPDRGVLIAGDALCTYNPLTGARGAQLMPKAFAARRAAGDRLAVRTRTHRRRRDAVRPRRALDGWPGLSGRSSSRGHVEVGLPYLLTRPRPAGDSG